jgi:hypothetical protein
MNIPGFERFNYRNEKNMNNPTQIYIIVTDKSIILYSYNEGSQYQGENGHTKVVIPSYTISQEHVKKVFSKFRGYHIDNLFDEGTMYIVDELLGDLFYNYDEAKLSEEFKTMKRTEPSMVNRKGDEEKDLNPWLSRHYLLNLIKFIKTKSPWRQDYTKIREELEYTRGLLGFFMPKEEDKEPTEAEEIAQADARAKHGAIKHRQAQAKMKQLMRSPEAESIRLQESEYPSVAEHVLSAGRKSRKYRKLKK